MKENNDDNPKDTQRGNIPQKKLDLETIFLSNSQKKKMLQRTSNSSQKSFPENGRITKKT